MQSRQRWITIVALLLLIVGTFWTISAQTNAGRDIWLPFINSSGVSSAATATPMPTTVSTADQCLPYQPDYTSAQLTVPPSDAASARLTVSQGFAVRIFAKGLNGPRLMTIGPDGALYVAERGAGRVVRLADANNDGLADKIDPVATGLTGAHSVAWCQDQTSKQYVMYIADDGAVVKWDNGQTKTIVDLPTGGGHTSRTAHIGPDGYLYVAAGSSCNACIETDKRRATIMRFNLDGSIPADNPFANDSDEKRQPVWAEGLRNSVDFLWMPDGQLWANMNSSDNISDDAPPEPAVIHIEKGNHYGWPFCYTPTLGAVPSGTKEVRDTANNVPFAAPISNCDQPTPVSFTDLAHQAPLGMTYYGATQFPSHYQGGLFEAYHGSWNTNNVANYRDCKVQFIQVQNNQPVASSTFLSGFRDANQKCGSAWGRPAGVAVGTHGELFVSDDQNGNIYRIVYTGK